ncbi:MAG: hypothetical protein M3391_09075 [Actinomycetota bacterium]|nr:hypothetical protein [Actinomycetota bacterium]
MDPVTVLIGGIGQLYQGDLDLGRLAAERLSGEDLGRGIAVEDLHYGAVAVAQRLDELHPEAFIIVGATERGREPGTVERRSIQPIAPAAAEVQRAVEDAVTGYVTVDLVTTVAAGFGSLPARTICIEVEPAVTGSSEHLSPAVAGALDRALQLVRAEARRTPLLLLADRLRSLGTEERLEPSPALDALRGLLAELHAYENEGRWGATFALRDMLKQKISEGETSLGMDHLDWGLWWALVEELDRLQRLEAEVP